MSKFQWQSLGHDTAKLLLQKQLEHGQFPHAYLFVGPEGIGKKFLAQEMAAQILHTPRLDNHPDHLYYNAAADEGMAGLRQFLLQLATKPFWGQYKVALMDNMDQANVQMSNALLKTLEEPSPSTIIFVIASQNNLLPTIISRCQMLSFNPLSAAQMQEYIASQKISANEQMLAASAGSPGRLQQLLTDPAATEQINSAIAQLQVAEQGTVAERLLAINALAELETLQIRQALLTWLYQLRLTLAQAPHHAQLMTRICGALAHLNGAFNKKMVLQNLLLSAYEIA